MDDEISKLRSLADQIKAAKHGERGNEKHVNSYTVIDEYHEWRVSSEDLLSRYFGKTNDHFKNFVSLPREGNGFTLMRYFDQQYPIFKILTDKIINGEVSENKGKIMPQEATVDVNNKSIFISHSSKDEIIATNFVDLILDQGLSVTIDQIFCTSTDGTKIKSGSDWRNSIYESLKSAEVTFLIITPNYKESEICQNEMGAAWVTSSNVIPLIVEPINYKTVGIIQEPKQIERLLDEKCLDRIRDLIQDELEIPSALIKSDRWTTKKTEFIVKTNKYIAENPFEAPLDKDTFKKVIRENNELQHTVEDLIEEKSDLETLVIELEKVKNREGIRKVKKNLGISSQYEEFEILRNGVKEKISKFHPIIIGIIFNSYTDKGLNIGWQGYDSILDDARASDYIDYDLEADFDTTREMSAVRDSLNDMDDFLNGDLKEEFYLQYEEKFKAPLKLDNKLFWEEVFDIDIRI